MRRKSRYSPEVRARVIRMVLDHPGRWLFTVRQSFSAEAIVLILCAILGCDSYTPIDKRAISAGRDHRTEAVAAAVEEVIKTLQSTRGTHVFYLKVDAGAPSKVLLESLARYDVRASSSTQTLDETSLPISVANVVSIDEMGFQMDIQWGAMQSRFEARFDNGQWRIKQPGRTLSVQ